MAYFFQSFLSRSAVFFTSLLVALLLASPTCSFPVTTRVGETCASNDDCSSTEYCRNVFKCAEIQYSPLIEVTGAAATSDSTAFNLIMASDPQFYFKICKKEPLSECIYHNLRKSKGLASYKSQLLIDAAKRQVECITALSSSLTDVKAVFDNGDLVNKGSSKEIAALETHFHDLINLPLVVGLGNHDYGMTDSSKGYSSEGRKDMINYLADAIIELDGIYPVRNIDFKRSDIITNAVSGNEEVYTTGSFCYSVDFNDYVFVMLHWSTALTTGAYKTKFQADDRSGAVTKTEFFDVTSPETWLKAELNDIKSKGKKAILVPHAYKGIQKFIQRVPDMSNFLRDSEVIAVLSGHVHDAWGYDQDLVVGDSTTRAIPVYFAGSTSYQKLIVLEMEADKGGIDVTAYDTATGANCANTTNASS